MSGEDALHACVGGDHGAARVGLGLEVVDRVGHLGDEVLGHGRALERDRLAAAEEPAAALVDHERGGREQRDQ